MARRLCAQHLQLDEQGAAAPWQCREHLISMEQAGSKDDIDTMDKAAAAPKEVCKRAIVAKKELEA